MISRRCFRAVCGMQGVLIAGGLLALGFILGNSPGLAQSSPAFILLQDQEPFYSPPSMTMKSGETVEWYNRSGTEHTITHDGCGRRQPCAFHSGHLHPGERFPVPKLAPGRYSYHCEIHPFMRGVIVVKSATPDFKATEL